LNQKEKSLNHISQQKKHSNGTGIGLYMSKIIVDKNMKGKLRVRNTKEGAKFANFYS
jgi:two-component system C4-dicarboxylate transport sensor histidine kinase DctB